MVKLWTIDWLGDGLKVKQRGEGWGFLARELKAQRWWRFDNEELDLMRNLLI